MLNTVVEILNILMICKEIDMNRLIMTAFLVIGLATSNAAAGVLSDFEDGTTQGWTGELGFGDTTIAAVTGDTPDGSTYALQATLVTPTGASFFDLLFSTGSTGQDWSGYDTLTFYVKSPQPTLRHYVRFNDSENIDFDSQLTTTDWTQVTLDLTQLTPAVRSNITSLSMRINNDFGAWPAGSELLYDRFVLVPEPGSAALVGLGVLGLLRRQRLSGFVE